MQKQAEAQAFAGDGGGVKGHRQIISELSVAALKSKRERQDLKRNR